MAEVMGATPRGFPFFTVSLSYAILGFDKPSNAGPPPPHCAPVSLVFAGHVAALMCDVCLSRAPIHRCFPLGLRVPAQK